MNSLTEEMMTMFWLGAGEGSLLDEDYNPLVDAETGNFYFWLGPQREGEDIGEDITMVATMVTRQDFENMTRSESSENG